MVLTNDLILIMTSLAADANKTKSTIEQEGPNHNMPRERGKG